jgi:gamma-glutamylcyclotransferase (GGCT)/AIG2-like uncharacterized protein YtfP
MNDHVFVYGTLRKGGVREVPRLFPAAPDLGPATLRGRIYDFGAFPGLEIDDHSGLVHGEVYGVVDGMLDAFDAIEEYWPNDYEASYYHRHRVFVVLSDGQPLECWTYVFNPKHFPQRQLIASGDWIAHAAVKGPLPPETWPDGDPIRK